jgi:hypothetical protein
MEQNAATTHRWFNHDPVPPDRRTSPPPSPHSFKQLKDQSLSTTAAKTGNAA